MRNVSDTVQELYVKRKSEEAGKMWAKERNRIVPLNEKKQMERFFRNSGNTFIWSCMQGIMGRIYARNCKEPEAAMAVLGDFTFFDGIPDRELAEFQPEEAKEEFRILVPPNREWERLIETCYGAQAEKIVRYAIKKEPHIFDREKLKKAVEGLPGEYELCSMDEALYRQCGMQEWSRDFTAQFPDYESFEKLGLGMLVLKDREIVAGASSYSRYKDGIEIEVDTKPEYRRQGLAYACCAGLMLECLERGLYPGWDAHNRESLALAQKLGYHLEGTYTAYIIG